MRRAVEDEGMHLFLSFVVVCVDTTARDLSTHTRLRSIESRELIFFFSLFPV